MARINNLTNFLNDVATAIKAKLGDNTPIPASQFDTKIGEIETVGTYQSKTLNIVANGSQTVTPDTGYDALSSVLINVQVPIPSLQTKTYEFTQNTHIILSPEQGYDGFSSIDLTINVPGSTINNQDKTITQNGTYMADSGYTGLGQVTVNVSGPDLSDATITAQDVIKDKIAYGANGRIVGALKGARYYANEQEMYADTNVSPVTYGLIYSELSNPLQNGDRIKVMRFPQTVVLDTAITSRHQGQIMGHEGDIYLNLMVYCNSTEAAIQDMRGELTVEYSSTDGITYTKTNGPLEYDLGDFVTVDDFEDLLSTMGPFIQKIDYYQGGLYKYDTYTSEEYVKLVTLPSKELTATFDIPDLFREKHNGGNQASLIVKTYHYDTNKRLNVIDTCDFVPARNRFSSSACFIVDNSTNKCYVGTSSTGNNGIVQHYDFSLSNPLVSEEDITTTKDFAGTTYAVYELPSTSYVYADNGSWNTSVQIKNYNGSSFDTSSTIDQSPQSVDTWLLAGNQYTLMEANELLPGVIAYGRTGIVTGDGSIYNNLDIQKLMQKMYGLSETATNRSKTSLQNQYFNNDNIVDDGCFCYDIPTGTQLQKETIYHLEPDNSNNMRLMLGKRTNISTTEQFTTSYEYKLYRYDYTSDKIIYIGYISGKIEFIVYDMNGNVLLHSPSISTTITDLQAFNKLWYYNNKLYFISYFDGNNVKYANVYEVTNSGMTKKTSNNIGTYVMGKCFDEVNGIFYFTSSDSTSSTSSVFTMKQYVLSTNAVTKLLNVNSATLVNSSKNYVAYCNADNTTTILRYKLKTASSWTNLTLPFSLVEDWWNGSAYLAEDEITGKLLVAFYNYNTGSQIVKINPSTNTYTTLEGPTIPGGMNLLLYVNDIIYYGPNVTKILPDGTTYKYATYNSPIPSINSYKLEICDTDAFKISGLVDGRYSSDALSTIWPIYYFEPRSVVPGFSNNTSLIFAKTNYDLFAIGNWKETLEVIADGESE